MNIEAKQEIQKLRQKFNLTQEQFAEKCGVSRQAVAKWEKDRKTLIYGQVDYMYGEALYKPEMKEGNPIRLYSLDEITGYSIDGLFHTGINLHQIFIFFC